jgi:hypothetical protein
VPDARDSASTIGHGQGRIVVPGYRRALALPSLCSLPLLELGGKRTLVGVYPGNLVLVPDQFPRKVAIRVWTTLHASTAGHLTGTVRAIRADDRSVVFEDKMSVTVSAVKELVPAAFLLICEVVKKGHLLVQVQGTGDEGWLALGSFEVSVG